MTAEGMARRLPRVLTGLYLFVSLVIFLYAYPWLPDRQLMIPVSLGLAWAAAYTAFSTPIFTSLVYSFSSVLSALTLAAATPRPWLLLVLRDLTLFTLLLSLTIALLALSLSARREELSSLATGAIAASALRLRGGEYLATAVLAIYSAVSGRPRATAIAALYTSYIYAFGVISLWALGATGCFTSLHNPGLNPVKPLVVALPQALATMPPLPNPLFYRMLAFSLLYTILNTLVYPLAARLASSIERRTLITTPYPGILSRSVIVSTPLITLLAFFGIVNTCLVIGDLLGCTRHAMPPASGLLIAGAAALLSLLYKLVQMLSGLGSIHEEKESMLEVLETYERELLRIFDVLSKRGLVDKRVESVFRSLKAELDELRNAVKRAGLLDLPLLTKRLSVFEHHLHEERLKLIEQLRKTGEEVLHGCETVSAFAAQNGLPTDCSEAKHQLTKLSKMQDIYNIAVILDALYQTYIDYIDALLEEIEFEAEQAGLQPDKLEEMRRIEEILEGIRTPSAEELREKNKELLNLISRLWGRVKARQA